MCHKYGFFEHGLYRQLDQLDEAVQNGDINFSDGAVIYLGGCNAGTCVDENSISFAQKLANVTGAEVVAATIDR